MFAHIPLILKPTGKGKLSKRDGEKFGHPVFPLKWVKGDEKHLGFKEFGILPEALINYMALLGWSKEDNKEIYSLADLLGSFKIKSVGKSGAKFDFEKLLWLNSQHIQKMSSKEIIKRLLLLNKGKNFNITKEAIDLIKPRIERLADIDIDFGYLFKPQKIDPSLEAKILNDDSKVFLEDYSAMLAERFESALQLKEDLGQCSKIGFGKSMGAMRLCLVGKLEGPDLFELMMFLGKKEVMKRIHSVIA